MIIIYYIRTILAAAFALFFFTIFSIIMLPILGLIGTFSPITKEKGARLFTRCGLYVVNFLCGAKLYVVGKENIPAEPCLFVCNHRSYFDVMSVYPVMKDYRLGYVGKKEFGKFYSFKLWMKWCGCTFLDRSNPREGLKAINESAQHIKDGINMWIFPEGTRNHAKDFLEFHEGSYRIAEKAGCLIVPTAVIHTDEEFELHMPYAKPTRMTVAFGKPISIEGLKKDELKAAYASVFEEIKKLYKENY